MAPLGEPRGEPLLKLRKGNPFGLPPCCNGRTSSHVLATSSLPSIHRDIPICFAAYQQAVNCSGVDRCEVVVQSAKAGKEANEVVSRDTGLGLSAEVSKWLFEPFVSTKPGGMGLGLSISRSIIERHGGRLSARPNSDDGIVFQLTLLARRGGDHRVGPS